VFRGRSVLAPSGQPPTRPPETCLPPLMYPQRTKPRGQSPACNERLHFLLFRGGGLPSEAMRWWTSRPRHGPVIRNKSGITLFSQLSPAEAGGCLRRAPIESRPCDDRPGLSRHGAPSSSLFGLEAATISGPPSVPGVVLPACSGSTNSTDEGIAVSRGLADSYTALRYSYLNGSRSGSALG
jgi:hypothetical protein